MPTEQAMRACRELFPGEPDGDLLGKAALIDRETGLPELLRQNAELTDAARVAANAWMLWSVNRRDRLYLKEKIQKLTVLLVMQGWDGELDIAPETTTPEPDYRRRYTELRQATERLLVALTSRVAFPPGTYAVANQIDCAGAMLARHDSEGT